MTESLCYLIPTGKNTFPKPLIDTLPTHIDLKDQLNWKYWLNQLNTTSDPLSLIKRIPFSVLIKLYTHHKLAYNYWTSSLIDEVLKLSHSRFIADLKNDIQSPEIVTLNNKFNKEFSFEDKLVKTRFDILKQIYAQVNLSSMIFGSNMVYLLSNEQLFNDVTRKKIPFSLKGFFTTPNIHFNAGLMYQEVNDVITVKIDNLIFHFKNVWFKSSDSCLLEEECIFDPNRMVIKCLPSFYQTISQLSANTYLSISQQFADVTKTVNQESVYPYIKKYDIDMQSLNKLKFYVRRNLPSAPSDTKNRIHFCYICKKAFSPLDSDPRYPSHCIRCGSLERSKLEQKANLTSWTVYISGGRIKIGFATALRLLRLGAKVIVSTRYPSLALVNYQDEKDYSKWCHNLELIQCDFTNIYQVNSLIHYLRTKKINVLINNSALTLKPSTDYTSRIEEAEKQLLNMLTFETVGGTITPPASPPHSPKNSSPIASSGFEKMVAVPNQPANIQLIKPSTSTMILTPYLNLSLNKFKDLDDPLSDNSWYKNIEEVPASEIMEVTAINLLVPTLLINQLSKYMGTPMVIINVTAVEGQFEGCFKNENHPHNNASKAGLNMLTVTLANQKQKNRYVYTIDPGFVSGGSNFPNPPLTMHDGASRIVDPIIRIANGNALDNRTVKLKDYVKSRF